MANDTSGPGATMAQRMLADARICAGRRFAGIRDVEAEPDRLRAILFVLTGVLPPEKLDELPREKLAGHARKVMRAIARERGKARCGHRNYDVNRHIALHQALRGLNRLIGKSRPAKPAPE